MNEMIRHPAAADPLLAPIFAEKAVAEPLARGALVRVHDALTARRKREKDPAVRDALDRLLADRTAFTEPKAPSLFRINGIGRTFIGADRPHTGTADSPYVTTLWWTVLFIPILPSDDYLVAGGKPYYTIFGRVPLAKPLRIFRRTLLGALLLLALLLAANLYHRWNHETVQVVNVLGIDVTVEFGNDRTTVPAGSTRAVRLKRTGSGYLAVNVIGPDRRMLDSDEITIAGEHGGFYAYNVLGAAPLVIESVVYHPVGKRPAGDAAIPPRFIGGRTFVNEPHVDYVFTAAPDQLSLRNGESTTRRFVTMDPSGIERTIRELATHDAVLYAQFLARYAIAFPDDREIYRRAVEAALAVDAYRAIAFSTSTHFDAKVPDVLPDTLRIVMAADAAHAAKTADSEAARASNRKFAESLLDSLRLPVNLKFAVRRAVLMGRRSDDLVLLTRNMRSALLVADGLRFPRGDARRRSAVQAVREIDTEDDGLLSILERRP